SEKGCGSFFLAHSFWWAVYFFVSSFPHQMPHLHSCVECRCVFRHEQLLWPYCCCCACREENDQPVNRINEVECEEQKNIGLSSATPKPYVTYPIETPRNKA
ncbi:unnamed protein product, partial [Sphacelaria rigidula]